MRPVRVLALMILATALLAGGDTLDIYFIDVDGGQLISGPMPGAGAPNGLCAGSARKPEDKGENGKSVGIIVRYGEFRFANLVDGECGHGLKLTAGRDGSFTVVNSRNGYRENYGPWKR